VLPLVAILVLEERPYKMAVIGGASAASGLAFGLIAGPWVDRTRRRMVLVVTDPGRVDRQHPGLIFRVRTSHRASLRSCVYQRVARNIQRGGEPDVLTESCSSVSPAGDKLQDGCVRCGSGADRIQCRRFHRATRVGDQRQRCPDRHIRGSRAPDFDNSAT